MTAERPRILALPRYGRQGASSRLRIWQYVPWLEAAEMEVEVRPLLPDSYIEELQAGRRDMLQLVRAYWRQASSLMRSRRFDLLWIEKELLPWLPGWLERASAPAGTPFVLDYDDAVYELYNAHRRPLVRSMLRNKHPAAMRRAAMVIAGNSTLAAYAERAGARNVRMVPTVVDLDHYPAPRTAARTNGPPRICWIGQHSTAEFLLPYKELFKSMAEAGQARFVAIGIDAAAAGLPMESVPWAEETEAAALARCHIGIMPLRNGPFERGKCGYKLIQYMASGLPVVASPVGANRDIVEHGVNGLLANSLDEWSAALARLAADARLRQSMGAAGRDRAERDFALQRTGPVMAELLSSAAREQDQGSRAALGQRTR